MAPSLDSAKVCDNDWTGVQKSYPMDSQGKENNIKWCFTASYATAFLNKGLHVPMDKKITIQKEVHTVITVTSGICGWVSCCDVVVCSAW